jgi:uncharacterized repeat protein (TIGR03806 family)
MRAAGAVLVALLALLGAACTPRPDVHVHPADAYPERLSEWGLVIRNDRSLVLGPDVMPYEVNVPLFTDYAHKLRTLYLPPGAPMLYHGEDAFDLPVGSVVTKTFFYRRASANGSTPSAEAAMLLAEDTWPGDVGRLDLADYRLLETRLLVRQAHGWDALPYVWRGDDAYLSLTGAVIPLTLDVRGEAVGFPYVVPSRSECASCHATDHADGQLRLVGMTARQLNGTYPGQPANQLQGWAEAGVLVHLPPLAEVPRLVPMHETADVAAHARAYLDTNCGHCHSPAGPGRTSGLLLDAATTDPRQLGVCKPPIAAGRGTGGHSHSIAPGAPDASIMVFRMEATDPAIRMPELGRSLSHREGVALIRDWIAGLPGECR